MNAQRILIVDTDREYAGRLAAALLGAGHLVECAPSLGTGQARARAERPDVLVYAHAIGAMDAEVAGAAVKIVEGDDGAAWSTTAPGTVVTVARPADAERLVPVIEPLLRAAAGAEELVAVGQPAARGCRGLVIDDELDHCEMIGDCLRRTGRESIELTYARTVREACRAIESEEFDFILLDHDLPDGTRRDFLEAMEARLLTTPVIGLSTSADPNVALAEFRGGALEFIEKHEAFQGDRLRRRVFDVIATHKRRVTASAAERRRGEGDADPTAERHPAAARTDALMGILNRAAFDDLHAGLHEGVRAVGGTYTVCLVDVDTFKKYNDHYGHAAGDDALRRIAGALRQSTRPGDYIVRYGGEEIALLLEGLGDAHAFAVSSRLCRSVADLELPHALNGVHGRVTVSVGAAILDPRSEETPGQIVERANAALHAAKAAGRNTAVLAAPKGADSRRCA